MLLIFLYPSCQNRENDLGLDLRTDGGVFQGETADGFTLISRTVKDDSFATDSLSSFLLGGLRDPLFGSSRSSVITQAVLREFNFSFDQGTRIDSVVLALRYVSSPIVYGPNSTQTLRVYKLNSALQTNTRYFSNSSYEKGNLVGIWSGVFAPRDSVRVVERNRTYIDPPQLRIRLDNALGDEFVAAAASNFTSNEAFLNFFKGLVVEASVTDLANGEGGIMPFNLNSGFSRLQVYYNDSLFRNFDLGGSARKYARYEAVDRSNEILSQFDAGGNFPLVYAQGMGGCKVKIDIPDLFDFIPEGKDILINEAVLTFQPETGSNSDFFPLPERLNLFQPDEFNGFNRAIVDYLDYLNPNNPYAVYGGSYNKDKNTYEFRINRQLQQMIKEYKAGKEKVNRGFFLTVPADFPVLPYRVVLNNANNSGFKLKVLYTELN
jgi:hypothetical protein